MIGQILAEFQSRLYRNHIRRTENDTVRVTVTTYKRKEVSRGLDSELHQALLADYIARRGHAPKGMVK